MWDRLLVDCNIATFEERPGNPLGLIENGAIGIADGKIVRVGKRTELAGFRAKEVDRARRRLGDAGPDRLPHPPRLRRHPRRRACDAPRGRELRGDRRRPAAASPRPSKRTAAASDEELLEQSRRRLHALMRGRLHDGRDQVGLRPRSARASSAC